MDRYNAAVPYSLIVRCEEDEDRAGVRAVNESAFGRIDEADLIESLRRENAVLLSLVAEVNHAIAGCVLFSRMWIDHGNGSTPAVALAPMAVLPPYQRQGIGGILIRRGLDSLRQKDEEIVIVLGHANYYSRFGFSTERARGLESPFPPEAYMALDLANRAAREIRGRVRYPAAFGL